MSTPTTTGSTGGADATDAPDLILTGPPYDRSPAYDLHAVVGRLAAPAPGG